MKTYNFFSMLTTLAALVAFLLGAPLATGAQGVAGGMVVGWGSNNAGQTDIPAGLTDVVAIATGSYHGLALKTDGMVVGWGYNTSGQATPPAGLTDLVAISAGDWHSLALKADGTVVGWGNNGHGQATPPAGLNDVVAISGGESHSLALKADGTVVGWGESTYATPPTGLTDVVAISAKLRHSLALKADGMVVGWGEDTYGQSSPPAGLTDVVAISAGSYHSLALKADGTIECWGGNQWGQCNTPAGLANVMAISGGLWHSLALKADGTVLGWGYNIYGQSIPPAGLTDVVAISAGQTLSLALVVLNEPPVASANGPYVVAVGQSIMLDHTGSYDPDGDDLTFIWEETGESDPFGTIAGEIFSAGDQAGINEVTLTVDDGRDGIATSKSMIIVYDPSGGFVTGGGWIDSPAGAYYPSDLPYYDGSYYEIVQLEPELTFAEARQAAEAMTYGTCKSAHLATITSQGEYDAVLGLFDTFHDATLGGYQDEDELVPDEGWQWVTGEPFDFEIQRDWWYPGEPNDCGTDFCPPGSEQVLVMEHRGDSLGWNDIGSYPLWIGYPMIEYENCDPDPIGKATFGFVSKYKKGADVPDGNTEFQFKAGDLNFHSTSYDWLVVTGSNYAKFKGTGTINGEGEYKFMIWAGDNSPDTFRIKIWYEVGGNEVVVYDNGIDQAIGGGSIVVHKK